MIFATNIKMSHKFSVYDKIRICRKKSTAVQKSNRKKSEFSLEKA